MAKDRAKDRARGDGEPASALVSAEWLAEQIARARGHASGPLEEGVEGEKEGQASQRPTAVLDATMHLPSAGRDGAAEFRAGHIPGARFLDLASLRDEGSPVPAAMPRPDQLAERLGRLGVSKDTLIVFYDDSAICSAARAWFLARAHGLENVALLDGGLARWKALGLPLESGDGLPATSQNLSLGPPRAIRFKQDILANLESGREQIVDARDPGRFTGQVEDKVHGLVGGHIPGARNLHYARLLREDGTWRSPDELRALLAEAGIDLDRPVVASCGSGVTACAVLFALHLIGHRQGALYDGSWLDWGSDPATPKETGPARIER